MIESHGLTKRLGGRTVVSDVSFACAPGTVTGFLGPNGAGKTTTMRMLCGLSDPDAGHAEILGGPYRALPNPGRRVGILLDASAQHAGRRGQETLTLSALTMGADPKRVPELLERVGLEKRAARQRVKAYSLGMRQRLGIANALIGDPEVLILDEPANGLDPEGMRWMRSLLRDFADRGGTVLLSSHLLHEVEAVADQLLIIGGGKIVAAGTRDELLAGAGTLVRAADDAPALEAAMATAGLSARAHPEGGFIVDAEPEEVGRAALAGGVALSRLGPSESAGLEQLFFDLTSGAPMRRRTAALARRPAGDRLMSTATARFDDPLSPRSADTAREHRPSLATLTRVELRKMYDTRAGFWLLLICVLLTLLVAVLSGLFDDTDKHTLSSIFNGTSQVVTLLLPIVGILLVTSEWSQRTAQVTFTLVPRRGRVLAAKVSASVVLALIAFALALVLAAVGTALDPAADGAWSLSAGVLAQTAFYIVISTLMGVALGAAILLSAPAIVASFVLPIGFSVATNLIPGLDGAARWLDSGTTLPDLTDHVYSAPPGPASARRSCSGSPCRWPLAPGASCAGRSARDKSPHAAGSAPRADTRLVIAPLRRSLPLPCPAAARGHGARRR